MMCLLELGCCCFSHILPHSVPFFEQRLVFESNNSYEGMPLVSLWSTLASIRSTPGQQDVDVFASFCFVYFSIFVCLCVLPVPMKHDTNLGSQVDSAQVAFGIFLTELGVISEEDAMIERTADSVCGALSRTGRFRGTTKSCQDRTTSTSLRRDIIHGWNSKAYDKDVTTMMRG